MFVEAKSKRHPVVTCEPSQLIPRTDRTVESGVQLTEICEPYGMLERMLVGEVSITVLMNLDSNASMTSNGVLGHSSPQSDPAP